MNITTTEIAAVRARLFGRPRNGIISNRPDFTVRPISEMWALANRRAAFKTAVANVAYIWRDSSATDRFGPMPGSFANRRCEVQAAGLSLPASAPLWAAQGYTIWREADAAAAATLDPCALSAWHIIAELPEHTPARGWERLVTNFIDGELTTRGAAVAWAIHALEADDGWIIKPHLHCVVAARYFRHDHRQGNRHPAWIGSWRSQRRLETAWRLRCRAAMALPGWTIP